MYHTLIIVKLDFPESTLFVIWRLHRKLWDLLTQLPKLNFYTQQGTVQICAPGSWHSSKNMSSLRFVEVIAHQVSCAVPQTTAKHRPECSIPPDSSRTHWTGAIPHGRPCLQDCYERLVRYDSCSNIVLFRRKVNGRSTDVETGTERTHVSHWFGSEDGDELLSFFQGSDNSNNHIYIQLSFDRAEFY